MMTSLPPGLILCFGALILPFLRGWTQKAWFLLLPILSFAHMISLPDAHLVQMTVFGLDLQPIRVDRLSLVWGYVFHIATLLCAIYALHTRDTVEHVAALAYAGSAIAAVFAGDLWTLFIWWEVTAISSVFLIWARRTPRSYRAGMRYLVIQVGSGVLLLAGLMVHTHATGSLEFNHLGLETPGGLLILLAFGIKCAFPLLHNWLQDAYPEATVTGTVFLSAFTTKLAVYALARGYAGESSLIVIGAIMTLFPIFFAVIENDLRRVLAYSLNNQLGFMVVGVGIGTELALNGTAAHAFAHIIYKALLFMAMGAVLHRTGTTKASELGGLYKSMPWTTAFCIIGSLSISGFPLFSGFVTKSMILSAGAEGHFFWLTLALLVASAGVVDHSGIKIPFFAFFAHDNNHRVEKAPINMRIAMGLASALCLGIGLFPSLLYSILPYPVAYVPYTASHILTILQLLLFAALAFGVWYRLGIYPAELRATNLDTDVWYRKGLPKLAGLLLSSHTKFLTYAYRTLFSVLDTLWKPVRIHHSPSGLLGEPWLTGRAALWAALLLAVYLWIAYL